MTRIHPLSARAVTFACMLAVASVFALLAAPHLAFAQTIAPASAPTEFSWAATIAAIAGVALNGVLGWVAVLLSRHQSKQLVLGALERAAGAGIAYAQQQQLDLTKPDTWAVMVRQAVGYMLDNYGDTLSKLGLTSKVTDWVTAALGKVLGPAAVPVVAGAVAEVAQGEVGPAVSDLTDAAIDKVASAAAAAVGGMPTVAGLTDATVGRIADAVGTLPLSSGVLESVVGAVAGKVGDLVPSAEAVAQRVVAALPPSLTGLVETGKRLAEATETELLTELVGRKGLATAPTLVPAETTTTATTSAAAVTPVAETAPVAA